MALVSLMGNVVTPEGRGRVCPCGLGRAATGASVLAGRDQGGPVNVTGTSAKWEEEERMSLNLVKGSSLKQKFTTARSIRWSM